MIPIVSTIALIGIILWFQLTLRVRPELAPISACATVLGVVYMSALAGLLGPLTLVLYACGLVLAGLGLKKAATGTDPARGAVTVCLVVFISAAATMWIWLHGQAYSSWDEFSHWGRVSKAISRLATLPVESTGVILKDYPPGTALFHYFILNSGFSEGGTYYSQSLLLISCVLAIASWQNLWRAPSYLLVLTLGFLLVAILGQGYTTVEVDHILGGFFAAAVGSIAAGGGGLRNQAALVPVLFCMPLLKPIGLLFALCAVAIIALEVARTWLNRFQDFTRRDVRRQLGVLCLLLLAPVVAFQSWNMRVNAYSFKKTFDVSFSVAGFRTLATPSQRSDTQQQVVDSFSRAFRQAPVGRNGNGVIESGVWRGLPEPSRPSTANQWMLVLLAASFLVCVVQTSGVRTTHVNMHVALFLGCIAYLVVLLYVYAFAFSTYEAVRVISFGRYASTWFLAWALALIVSLGQTAAGTTSRYVTGLVLLAVLVPWGLWRAPHEDPAAVIVRRARVPVQQVVRRVDNLISKTSSAYVIWQETNGFQFHLTSYELSPRRTNTWCWALGEKTNPADAWTCPLTPDEFADDLRDFDYVLVMRGNAELWRRYRSLLAPGTPEEPTDKDILFAVDKDGSSVTLRPVPVP